jgi:uncharacterized protein (TIGR03118 family)
MKRELKYLLGVLAITAGCRKSNVDQKDLRDFVQVNLVSNDPTLQARRLDNGFLNTWGIAWNPAGVPWINANHTGMSLVLTAEGDTARTPVIIPTAGGFAGGQATGIVLAAGKGFKLPNGGGAVFLFVGEDGVLSGWNPQAGDNAMVIRDLLATSSFKGLAIGAWGGNNYIYATDFRQGKVIVWDTNFNKVAMPFYDSQIPEGFSPFNIQAVGSWLVVTYAKVGNDGDDVQGPGNGFVDIFSMDGHFIRRLATRGPLNSPWGVTAVGGAVLDADDLGEGQEAIGHGHKVDNHPDSVLLVGNFGDGRINAFDFNGRFLGPLRAHSRPIEIDGLWSLSTPPATSNVDQGRLYFTAGPQDERDGLFGYLRKQ